MVVGKKEKEKIIDFLKSGGVCVLPTDTVYGLHCLASNKKGIEKIHLLKKEEKDKPLINLISDKKDVSGFGIKVGESEKIIIDKYWPGPNTIIFGKNDGSTVSFRVPADKFLIEIIKRTGPLVSTSANIHGYPPAKNVDEAIEYFGDEIDLYVDGGNLGNPPSSIYKIEDDGGFTKIR